MLVILILPVLVYAGLDAIGCNLPVLVGKGKYFVSTGFYGARFMDVDMAGLSGDYSLIGTQESVDHDRIRLRSSRKKEDIGFRDTACVPDFLFCGLGILIKAVSCGLGHICFRQTVEYLRVCAFHVI